MEDLYGAVAQYYDVQYPSLRTAMYRLSNFKSVRWADIMNKGIPGYARIICPLKRDRRLLP